FDVRHADRVHVPSAPLREDMAIQGAFVAYFGAFAEFRTRGFPNGGCECVEKHWFLSNSVE
ncbi:MAG: hypothetical protein ACLSGC_10015, partial [Bifidobacterium pseudocatenulatum]